MINRAEKLWGWEEWLINNELYCCKYLHLNRGFRCSVHYHKNKDETFYIKRGVIKISLKQGIGMESKLETKILNPREQIRIKPHTLHCFESVTPTSLILEVSTHHEESDSYRLIESRKIS